MWHKAAHIAAVANPTSKTPKAERLVARVSLDDKRTIERAAVLSGQSVASLVIAHARDAAEKALERHERIRLNAEESKRFVGALLAPARKPPKAAKAAFENYRRTVTEM
jgi:uncharacterized protein (DUF1778 family)